jgi:methionyl-tRNA formyltransferase
MTKSLHRVVLVGDSYGIPELVARVPADRVVAVVAAGIRPDSHTVARECAASLGVPMLVQPKRSSAEFAAFADAVGTLDADGLLCHSYSMRIPAQLLAIVGGQAFNVHMSLLPRHRGPNPVQWALIHGDTIAGVTLHVMDAEFDRGPIVDQVAVAVAPTDTWLSLLERLKAETHVLLDRVVPSLLSGQWRARPQDESAAVRNHRLTADNVVIDFATMSDQQVVDLVRAQVAPLAGAFLEHAGERRHFPAPLTLVEVAHLRAMWGAHV